MATKGQTHQKRARELARKERRELKQAKKEARAAGIEPVQEGESTEPAPDGQPESDSGWIQ